MTEPVGKEWVDYLNQFHCSEDPITGNRVCDVMFCDKCRNEYSEQQYLEWRNS